MVEKKIQLQPLKIFIILVHKCVYLCLMISSVMNDETRRVEMKCKQFNCIAEELKLIKCNRESAHICRLIMFSFLSCCQVFRRKFHQACCISSRRGVVNISIITFELILFALRKLFQWKLPIFSQRFVREKIVGKTSMRVKEYFIAIRFG